MRPTIYRYTNSLGRRKELWMDNTVNMKDEHSFLLWDVMTGECCGNGVMTTTELEELLSHMKNVEKEG